MANLFSDAHCGTGCQSGPCKSGGSDPPGPANPGTPNTGGGKFDIIGRSGVPAMHAGLLANGRVWFLDKVEDFAEIRLPNGRFAYASEYDPATNQVVALSVTVSGSFI